MRDFKNMKRQRGRNRGGGMGGNSGGGGKPQQNANRAFDSNGPENVKIRGHAQHVFEKYQQLARDAFSSGDRVVAENYLQHADHYFRVLRTIQPQRSPSEILGRDSLASGLDIDFEEEFEQVEDQGGEAAVEASQDMAGGDNGQARQEGRDGQRYDREGRRDGYEAREGRQDRFEPRRDNSRDGGDAPYREQNRDQGQRDQGQREQGQYRDQGRDQGQYREQGRDQGQHRDQNQGQYRDRQDRDRPDRDRQSAPRDRADARPSEAREGQDRDRQDRDRQDRGERPEGRRDNRRFEGRPANREVAREGRFDERRPVEGAAPADPLPVMAPEAAAQPFPASAPDAEASPVLRSQDGGMSEAPAFLQPVSGEEGEARKPRARRRRAPRSFEAPEGGEAPAPIAEAEDA